MALIADAAKLRAGGPFVASLQRLAFAASFADASHFAVSGGGPSSACELADSLADVPTDLFESVRQSPVLHELPGLELIGQVSEHGWAWRSVAGLGLGLRARAAVEGGGWRARGRGLRVEGTAADVEKEAAA